MQQLYSACFTRAALCLQVPLFLRQWVTAVGAVPATSRSAYTYNGYITFFTDTTSQWGDVMIHESAHAQDQGYSGSDTFLNAIGSDTCIPDNYAHTNNVECYAQDMVVFLYTLWRPYAPPPSPGTGCMFNQLAALHNSDAAGLQDHIRTTGIVGAAASVCASVVSHLESGMHTSHVRPPQLFPCFSTVMALQV